MAANRVRNVISNLTTMDEYHRQRHYLSMLLGCLFFVLLVAPLLEGGPYSDMISRFGIISVLVFSVALAKPIRWLWRLVIFTLAIAALFTWTTTVVQDPRILAACCLIDSLFFLLTAIIILVSVISKHLATIHSIVGAISAYLLLGLGWAILYWGVDHFDQNAFDVASRRVIVQSEIEGMALSQWIYFSFVTMSTLGYGDMTPVTSVAQTLTWMQSVVGQFYIAVLVAWLVSEIPTRPGKRKQLPPVDDTSEGQTERAND